jgi:hypothetical protein
MTLEFFLEKRVARRGNKRPEECSGEFSGILLSPKLFFFNFNFETKEGNLIHEDPVPTRYMNF